jgi:hypothetical protein
MSPDETARARMAAKPFAPLDAHVEYREVHAAEYTAYYLGEIAKHLDTIAAQMKNETTNSSKIALALMGVQHVLPTLLQHR